MIFINRIITPSPVQWEAVMRGMRNPKNSWHLGDTKVQDDDSDFIHLTIGENDVRLAKNLCRSGPEHAKFLRQLPVMMDIRAPLYWWKQMDQYKIGTVTDSCSTMHKLTDKPFYTEDFAVNDLIDEPILTNECGTVIQKDGQPKTYPIYADAPTDTLSDTVDYLNILREAYIDTGDMKYWHAINKLLPQSYMQLRTWSANYAVLKNICRQREGHKIQEWEEFISIVRSRVTFAEQLIFDNWEAPCINIELD